MCSLLDELDGVSDVLEELLGVACGDLVDEAVGRLPCEHGLGLVALGFVARGQLLSRPRRRADFRVDDSAQPLVLVSLGVHNSEIIELF